MKLQVLLSITLNMFSDLESDLESEHHKHYLIFFLSMKELLILLSFQIWI